MAWTPVIEALERQAPSWPPGTAHGYHATTYGWLVGEVVRRVSGRSLGTYLRDEITGPLGAEFFVGLPPAEEPRVARLVSFLDSSDPGRPLASLADGADQFAGMEEQIAHYLAADGPLTMALGAPPAAPSRTPMSGTIRACTRRRCRRPTASATPGRWPASTGPV